MAITEEDAYHEAGHAALYLRLWGDDFVIRLDGENRVTQYVKKSLESRQPGDIVRYQRDFMMAALAGSHAEDIVRRGAIWLPTRATCAPDERDPGYRDYLQATNARAIADANTLMYPALRETVATMYEDVVEELRQLFADEQFLVGVRRIAVYLLSHAHDGAIKGADLPPPS